MKRRVLDLLRRGAVRRSSLWLGLLLGLSLLAIPTLAQTGGGFDLSWSTVDGGGGTSSGGGYGVSGTIGQHDAGTYSGGGYAVTGGFWGAAVTSATPTPCPIQFADVLPDNTFYPHVRCLACRGIDTGYACGGPGEPCNPQNQPYFRINSLIKRDDLAHMVAASAGFNEDPGPRRFQDVPPSNPYYVWVQRMANRGLIGGYPCGAPGEPCDGQNRPYFRPGNNVTRGQIAKILSNAALFNDTPTGQTFEDVTVGSTFYLYIERMASRGIIGGYPCGGEGEPCGPQSKPYFRWGNNATRGQLSKMIYLTLQPR